MINDKLQSMDAPYAMKIMHSVKLERNDSPLAPALFNIDELEKLHQVRLFADVAMTKV